MSVNATERQRIRTDTGDAQDVSAGRGVPGKKLWGKVALVNCGEATMAHSVARSFAMEGARIALCNAVDPAQAQETRRTITDHGGICVIFDERSDGSDACRRLVENVVGQLGALDVLFNCASHDPELGIEQISRIEATFRGSVFAYLHLMTAALPYLPDGGCVINSSSLGTGPAPADPGHAAAECAIVALTQSFARAAASRGIRVNAVSCAVYRTDPQRPGDRAANRSPAHKRGESSGDAGAACVFLACSDSQHISGQILRLDLEHSTRA